MDLEVELLAEALAASWAHDVLDSKVTVHVAVQTSALGEALSAPRINADEGLFTGVLAQVAEEGLHVVSELVARPKAIVEGAHKDEVCVFVNFFLVFEDVYQKVVADRHVALVVEHRGVEVLSNHHGYLVRGAHLVHFHLLWCEHLRTKVENQNFLRVSAWRGHRFLDVRHLRWHRHKRKHWIIV